MFACHGTVLKANVAQNRKGLSRGFAFVEMDAMVGAKSAVEAVNQLEYDDRTLSCKIVPPRDSIARGKAVKVKPDGPIKKKEEEEEEEGGDDHDDAPAANKAKPAEKKPSKVVAF